ncbi:MBL fold metallo-hydrolase [Pseudoflavonifractor sp. 60]|uniref:ComEC/Rec2 family competence protein n=1 Tax=Pseudoflavonifractor sp. 60 TaxID=2304576 RepID=UPI00136BFEBF|nr:MBL fold metallo-hydrolase [Pseudoflavonifractor sp. 60]NBI68000.1 MBL fold metallo-hydrolase [Pseudoflavonifractor sp. 60]
MKRKLTGFLLALLLLVSLAACGQTGELPPEGSSFEVHFIDVGQADSALVVCDGHYMLIDGGNAEDSDLVYAYLERHGAKHLDYMVATHAHEDHIGGLSGALNYASVDTALCPVTEYSSKVFQNMVKYLGEQGKSLTVPESGDKFSLGSAEVEILGPVKEYDDTNDTSIVLRIDYGDVSFLFAGDMEKGAEKDLIETGADLKADVLKAGHHGSDTSTSYQFLREVSPKYTVISVGEGNSYGHPSEEVLSRFRDAGTEVYRTDMQGHVIAESDGKTVTFRTEKEADTATNPTGNPQLQMYVGNAGTKKFHLPDCASAKNIQEDNQVVFLARFQAVLEGYEPCGRCKP